MTPRVAILLGLTAFLPRLCADTCYVSLRGDDSGPGTKTRPFRTIQKAADTVKPGDTCTIMGGTYREAVVLRTSGEGGKPIRFVAAEGQRVVLDGTEPVTGTWRKHQDGIYRINLDAPVEQLFADGQAMVEARWPNMDFPADLFSRKAWAGTVKGSRYGTIKDPQLAKTGIDWTGAHITLNVAHQFFTWTRSVTGHGKGKDTLTYPQDLQGITHYAESTKGWEDDYYFLSGKLEALDSPGEWFYDAAEKVLYFHPPGGRDPSALEVAYRKRQNAFSGKRLHHVELCGLSFFSCSFDFEKCENVVVDRCRLSFPNYSRHVRDPAHKEESSPRLLGDRNVVRNCIISYASHSGLQVVGDSNLVENCLIHDVCWHGCLGYPGLLIAGEGSTTRRNTIYNGGNALLQCPGGNQRVEYNHVYNGGLLCRDVSLVYTQLPACRGTVIHHNWVHGCIAAGFAGHDGFGGIGIRGDDQTRGLTVHHNVVWDCGFIGIIVKGDDNKVFNNTVFNVGPPATAGGQARGGNALLIPTRAEPKKPWRFQHPLLEVQNANSLYLNNAVGNIGWRKDPLPKSERITNNLELGGKSILAWLVDPGKMDFRPKEDSPLVDAGRVVPGCDEGHRGKAPDIGAYEYGQSRWRAGCDLAADEQAHGDR